jgi:hypothetical protein
MGRQYEGGCREYIVKYNMFYYVFFYHHIICFILYFFLPLFIRVKTLFMPLIYGKTVLAMGRDISEVYGSLLRKKIWSGFMPLIYRKTVLAMGRDISEVYGSLLRKKLCTRSIRPSGLVLCL